MREIGLEGEDVAAEYLEQNGYRILERNFFAKWGEIDLIVKDKEFLIFVEVKAYQPNSMVDPREAITRKKQSSILSASRWYLYKKKIEDVQCRFDLVVVRNNSVEEHLKHIFEAG